MEEELDFRTAQGTKIAYSETKTGTFTEIPGCTKTPDHGGAPAQVDTTTLANKGKKTSINGLQEASQLEYEFNMEDPSVESNIKLAYDIAQEAKNNNKKYWFKETLSNGIAHIFQGQPYIKWTATEIDKLLTFTLGITVSSEEETEIPVN